MFTISDIITDINRGCAVNNMVEDCFSYRIICFVNEGNRSSKYYIDTAYDGLRGSLENFIRGNLSTANTIVVSAVTVLKNGKAVSLLSRAYPFSLSGYFEEICETKEKEYKTANYGRKRVQWG